MTSAPSPDTNELIEQASQGDATSRSLRHLRALQRLRSNLGDAP